MSKSQQPSWKRKRFIAGSLLAMLIGYPLGAGPAAYLDGRGWMPRNIAIVPWLPLLATGDNPITRIWLPYVRWCERQGKRHARPEAGIAKAAVNPIAPPPNKMANPNSDAEFIAELKADGYEIEVQPDGRIIARKPDLSQMERELREHEELMKRVQPGPSIATPSLDFAKPE